VSKAGEGNEVNIGGRKSWELPKAEKDVAKMGANERGGVRSGRGQPSGGRSRDMVTKEKQKGSLVVYGIEVTSILYRMRVR
jgi:hypothetical protein